MASRDLLGDAINVVPTFSARSSYLKGVRERNTVTVVAYWLVTRSVAP